MKLKFSKVSPGGNLTVLVWDKIKKERHPEVANMLMDCETHLGAEQVGYVEESIYPGVVAHLQMMGGEFCGNATRALAYMLVRNRHSSISIDNKLAKFSLSVSGVRKPLSVEVRCDSGNQPISSKVEMPIYSDLNSVSTMIYGSIPVQVVQLEGITHMVVDKSDYAFDNSNYKSSLKKLRNEFGLNDKEAVGLMWITKSRNNLVNMDPVVWVKKTDSYYYETSCGSGTIAVALSMAKYDGSETQQYIINQPSGSSIIADVYRDQNSFLKAYIDGDVALIAEGYSYI